MALHSDGVGEDESGPAWAGRLARVLDRLFERYSLLRVLCERQGALIEGDDPGPLVDVLHERQVVVDDLAQAHGELEALRVQWERDSSGLPADLREAIRLRIDSIEHLACEVATQDDADRARLARRRDEIAERLVEIGRGRGAHAAYAGPSAGPSFQDTEA